MKKYEVTFYYHTSCTVVVEAKNEDGALELAESMVDGPEYTEQILEGLQEDADPDVDEITDDEMPWDYGKHF